MRSSLLITSNNRRVLWTGLLLFLLVTLLPRTSEAFQPAPARLSHKTRTIAVTDQPQLSPVIWNRPRTSPTLYVSLGAPNMDNQKDMMPRDDQDDDTKKKPLSSIAKWALFSSPLGALAVLSFVVMFHELGHFLTAKSFGVAVDEFSIGLGPKLLAIGDTFKIRALPLGGYVSTNRVDMAALPWILQVQILSAGVMFNLLLAWIIYTAQIYKGQGLPVPVFDAGVYVGGIIDEKKVRAPAKGLLHPGEVILAANGKKILAEPTTSELEVNRAIDKLLAEVHATPDGGSVVFTVVDPNKKGSRVKNIEIQPKVWEGNTKPSVGVYLSPNFVGIDVLQSENPLDAATLAASQVATLTKETSIGILTFMKDQVTGKGKESPYRVTGPAGVLQRATKIVETQDWRTILNYAAAASINLGMFNFLPVPPTDGFQILMTTLQEILKQAPLQ